MCLIRHIGAFVALCTLATSPSLANTSFDLADLSLEELMNIQVELVSRRPQCVVDVPAAVYALTAEEIRRAGARTIPDALRLIPGVQVARVDANKWAISARGFNGLFANKLLVLIDGRTVYSPLFSGVFWEAQDVVLDDVERIEVIRGPGGTLWGANAVNGIINIATRRAAESKGTRVEISADQESGHRTTAVIGGSFSPQAHYRIYARYDDRSASMDHHDGWQVARSGMRADWQISDRDQLTLQSDIYDGEVGQTYQLPVSLTPPYVETFTALSPIKGANGLIRWRRSDNRSDLHLQSHYDYSRRNDRPLTGRIDVFDLDFQHQLHAPRHEFVWGMGYRRSSDRVEGSFALSYAPERNTAHLFSAFVQDQIALADKNWLLTLGSKLEHNTYTNWEWQPSARLLWHPRSRTDQTLWLSLTRAVRTPSRTDVDMRIATQVLPADALGPNSPLTLISLVGDRQLKSEKLLALEAGYRATLGQQLRFDLAAFYNIYDDLRSSEPGEPTSATQPVPHIQVPINTFNLLGGSTYGTEITADWQALRSWQLRAAYSLLYMDIDLGRSRDQFARAQERESPRQQFVLRSMAELHRNVQLDLSLRHTGALPAQSIKAYTTLDLNFTWSLRSGFQWQLTARDLFSSPRHEFTPLVVASLPTRIDRNISSALSWHF